jgi:PST family polysaccharide transporter
MSESSKSSYDQILRSSSLIGGAQGINLLLGMVRVKFAAVLIGPPGVGLVANFAAIQGLVGNVAGLGIQSSAVRDVAEAVGRGDEETIGRTILTLRRISRLTGLIGMLAMIALAGLLSRWTFGSEDHALEVAALGLVILLGNISGGQTALIQGMRRIGDLARLTIVGSLAGTLITVGCYWWLGMQGIVPAMVLMAFVQLAASWHFARRVPVPAVHLSWWESLRLGGSMLRLGLVFMWSALIGSLVIYLTRALITQQLGLEAVGIFSAAFALSGLFVGFVLGAMGADYYPRLTAVASDRETFNKLVNEQTEVGLLLAVPGLLATLSLATWVVHVFYTPAFLQATDLLQWFVLGCLGQVISWPLGFVMLALGRGRWFFVTQTATHAVHLALIGLGMMTLGIEGVAIAFFVQFVGYTAAVYAVARHLTGFAWSQGSRRLLLRLLPIVAVAFVAEQLLPLWSATVFGVIVTSVTTVVCLRGLEQRVGPDHRLVRLACRVPGMRLALRCDR